LRVDDTVAEAAVDRFGNAVGGVPSPFLNKPIACYEAHSTPGPLCKLAGRETLLPYEELTGRYGDLNTYLAEFTTSLDDTIRAGFLLDGDRAGLLDAQTIKAKTAFSSSSNLAPTQRASAT
jgi:Alpha/beta hydrolase domain